MRGGSYYDGHVLYISGPDGLLGCYYSSSLEAAGVGCLVCDGGWAVSTRHILAVLFRWELAMSVVCADFGADVVD